MTKVAECLSFLMQLLSDLFLDIVMIYGNKDTVLVTLLFNCSG